jgi:hypothetical protein
VRSRRRRVLVARPDPSHLTLAGAFLLAGSKDTRAVRDDEASAFRITTERVRAIVESRLNTRLPSNPRQVSASRAGPAAMLQLDRESNEQIFCDRSFSERGHRFTPPTLRTAFVLPPLLRSFLLLIQYL